MPDFSDSVLIHRSEIEEINTQIRVGGYCAMLSICSSFTIVLTYIGSWRGQVKQYE